MRKLILLITSILFVLGLFAQKSIVVTNSSSLDRKGEIVDVKVGNLKSNKLTEPFVLKSSDGKEIAYQLTYNDKKIITGLIFHVDVKGKSTAIYTFTEGMPAIVKPKTSVQFIPERKDDLAWENDLAAYRMYGPALAKENPSNGVDLWLKRTDELIVAKFYHDELQKGLSYHIDHGQGLDCYTVGHTLGAGGIAPYFLDSLWVGNQYKNYKIIENGPLRSKFILTYDSVKIGNEFYKQTICICSSAGSMLNKAVVKFEGKNQKMKLAAGIFLHDGKGSLNVVAENGIIAYAENAVSNAKVASGRNYIGVYMPPRELSTMKKNNHILVLSDYKTSKEFTYYFGGGWSKWGYPTDDDWFNALKTVAENFKNPLKVKIE